MIPKEPMILCNKLVQKKKINHNDIVQNTKHLLPWTSGNFQTFRETEELNPEASHLGQKTSKL